MTESEKRREELLRRARTIYSDKKIPPAVHPRYQSFYTKLYDTQEEHDRITQYIWSAHVYRYFVVCPVCCNGL